MPILVTKTDLQRREYFHQLDNKEGNKVLQEILSELRRQKEKKTLNVTSLRGMNSRFQRQINRITQLRNTKNMKCRNKWNTIFYQEIAKFN